MYGENHQKRANFDEIRTQLFGGCFVVGIAVVDIVVGIDGVGVVVVVNVVVVVLVKMLI